MEHVNTLLVSFQVSLQKVICDECLHNLKTYDQIGYGFRQLNVVYFAA